MKIGEVVIVGVMGAIVGCVFGCLSGSAFVTALDLSEAALEDGDSRYAKILWTVGRAHELGRDKPIWDALEPYYSAVIYLQSSLNVPARR